MSVERGKGNQKPYVIGRVLIKGLSSDAAEILADIAGLPRVMRNVKRSVVLGTIGGSIINYQEVKALYTLKYTVKWNQDFDKRVFSFELIDTDELPPELQEKPHHTSRLLKRLDVSFAIEDYDDERFLIVYRSHMSSRFFIPVFIQNAMIKRSIPRILEDLKTAIESRAEMRTP